jgi:hypothetical protein
VFYVLFGLAGFFGDGWELAVGFGYFVTLEVEEDRSVSGGTEVDDCNERSGTSRQGRASCKCCLTGCFAITFPIRVLALLLGPRASEHEPRDNEGYNNGTGPEGNGDR